MFRRACFGVFTTLGVEVGRGEVTLTHCNIFRKMPGVLVCWPSLLAIRVDNFLRDRFSRAPLRTNVDLAVKWEVPLDSELKAIFDGAQLE